MSSEAVWLVNGEATASIAVGDRGLAYGDGLFETLRARSGYLPAWQLHCQRLTAGCERLALPQPDFAQLEAEALQLLATQGEGVIKIILTRGSGGRGYRAPGKVECSRIVSWHPAPQYADQATAGVNVRLCSTRLAQQPLLAGLKHLNRLEQVLARQEWQDDHIAEGIVLDTDGNVIEGTMSNLFLQSGSRLLTPDLDRCGVAGVMRDRLLPLLQAEVASIRLEQLLAADHLWLCNSVIGLWPVRQLNIDVLADSMIDGPRRIAFELGSITATVQQQLCTEDGLKR